MSNKNNVYLPNQRTGYKPKPSDLISYGRIEHNSTMLPSTVEDDIAVNNIAFNEFDYTENFLHDEEE